MDSMNADQIELPPGGLEEAFGARVSLPSGEVLTWPTGQAVANAEDPQIFTTCFLDSNVVHREFQSALLEQASRQPIGLLGFGGKKIRERAVWDLPAAKLLTTRALLFFCRCYGASAAHTNDKWANVLEAGDYSYPHCHYDSQASLVYYLDPGEPDPKEKLSGRFHLSDPRIAYCCSTQTGRPTRGLLPNMRTGTLLMFPSELVHFVHPYRGRRPRITLAWNISPGPAPATPHVAEGAERRGMFIK